MPCCHRKILTKCSSLLNGDSTGSSFWRNFDYKDQRKAVGSVESRHRNSGEVREN